MVFWKKTETDVNKVESSMEKKVPQVITIDEQALDNLIPTCKCYIAYHFIEPGVASWGGKILYVGHEALWRMSESMRGKPVLLGHEKDIEKYKPRGWVTRVWREEGADYYNCEFILECPEAIQAIKDGAHYVSCAYLPTEKGPEGTKNGVKYDFEIVDGVYLHLAITKNPRYDDAIIIENELDVDEVITNGVEINEKEIKPMLNIFKKNKSEIEEDTMVETKKGMKTLSELIQIANEAEDAIAAKDTEIETLKAAVEAAKPVDPKEDETKEDPEPKEDPEEAVENEDLEGFNKLKKSALEVPVIENTSEVLEESTATMEERGNKLYSIKK
jgi:hypothetical protein